MTYVMQERKEAYQAIQVDAYPHTMHGNCGLPSAAGDGGRRWGGGYIFIR